MSGRSISIPKIVNILKPCNPNRLADRLMMMVCTIHRNRKSPNAKAAKIDKGEPTIGWQAKATNNAITAK